MNLPNKITLSRIFLVPIFMLFIMPLPQWLMDNGFLGQQINAINSFLSAYGNYIAAAIFVIAASSDGVDGYIARKRNQVTKFGKFLDPIADKLLVISALIALVQKCSISGWVALIIIAREISVTGLRLVAAGEGIVIAAGKWGKIKTLTQITAIVAILIDNYPFRLFTPLRIDLFLMFLAVLITIYSGYDYIAKNINLINYKD